MARKPLQFRLNGAEKAVFVEDGANLLDVLRRGVGDLTPKYGCGQGECGACTVLVDGKPTRSCTTAIGEVAEKSIQTIEELAAGGEHPAGLPELIQPDRRQGKAANDTLLLQRARGEYALLLNEDSELLAGAAAALLAALDSDPEAGAAGAQLHDPDGHPQPCAWRLPGVGTAFAQALFLHKWLVTQSRGIRTRRVGWAQSAAMLVRLSAAATMRPVTWWASRKGMASVCTSQSARSVAVE